MNDCKNPKIPNPKIHNFSHLRNLAKKLGFVDYIFFGFLDFGIF